VATPPRFFRKKSKRINKIELASKLEPKGLSPKLKTKEDALAEFENIFSQQVNIRGELVKMGAKVYETKGGKPKKQGYLRTQDFLLETLGTELKSPKIPPKNLPVVSIKLFKRKLDLAKATLLRKKEPRQKTEVALTSKRTGQLTKVTYLDKREKMTRSLELAEQIDSFMIGKTAVSSPASREIDILLDNLKKKTLKFTAAKSKGLSKWDFIKRLSKKYIGGLIIVVFLLAFFIQKGIDIKNDAIDSGNIAIINLEKAKENLEELNFFSAANNFALAGKNFSQASKKLNLMGASFISLFSDIPGLSQVKNAKNLLKAGKEMSLAGESLANAFDELSYTNFVSYFGSPQLPQKPLSEYINQFRSSLIFAKEKISNTREYLEEVDISTLPDSDKELFADFKGKIPRFQEFTDSAINYSDFLLNLVGSTEYKQYLVLFQNNSELRPTGGFPGTYGILKFNQGYLEEIFVDDIYNPDGQIKKNIIPPHELQHITPTWGMRDANWFADFPTSARKVMEMYELDGGLEVDGVFSFTPTVITRILEIIGPIEMPEYDVILDANNFLPLVQSEVEYGENKEINQPKKIIVDFTPKFIEKLAEQDKENWLKIFQMLIDGMLEKHILAYLKDPEMQTTVVENNFAGEVGETEGDFLLVTHSNIKGSKTDAVIKNSIEIETKITEKGFIEHVLKITRSHSGGKTPYGFYNRQNPDYIRVMVPKGSELLQIKGNSRVFINPIVDYDSQDSIGIFVTDPDLQKYESQVIYDRGIKVFPEAGKTVFGFWLLTDPGDTRTVTVKYLTPVKVEDGEYSILIQKQPGTLADKLDFRLIPPSDKQVVFRYPVEVQSLNGNLILDSDLLTDRIIGISWR